MTLPHDAMLHEKRNNDSLGGTNTGWYEADDYMYKKCFDSSVLQGADCAILEFEGVYKDAEVYVNDRMVSYRPYGYTNFYVDIKGFLYNGENVIKVIAKNSDQPNSRWYSGAGIYRPVWLYTGGEKRIKLNGVKIKTVSYKDRTVEVEVNTTASGQVSIEVLDGERVIRKDSLYSEGTVKTIMKLPECELWGCDSPKLYTLRVTYFDDEQRVRFGIREISCDKDNGFCLNGERVILRGACIHSDNGILGACTYYEAEERKVRLLKQVGYNAIRCAHNPCAKYLLDACDELGMLVMDEYTDMWYIHKTQSDYALHCEQWYEQDIADMIAKDYNHPSVIMYSLGNEVGESASPRGVAFFEKMKSVCDSLDGTRPVTCGVNILFNYMSSLGVGVYSDQKAKQNPQRKVGSEFFNTLAGIFGSHTMKVGAMLHGCDVKTRDVFAKMDVAGYNYGILRYKHDLKKYPDRIIVGSETFCSDVNKFMELARENNRVIGDFVWAGMDYLGEVGIGAWEYRDYAPDYKHGPGWISAGSGRLDLNGRMLGEALYTKVAFGLESNPQIAVVPVNHTNDRHSPSAWKYSNALCSWSWDGCDGKKARVEVYSNAHKVGLFINGETQGCKKVKNGRTVFFVTYRSGAVKAISYDSYGKITGEHELKSAGNETLLAVDTESTAVKKGQLLYVTLRYTDYCGNLKPMAKGRIRLTVEGGKLLGFGHACPYNEDGFLSDSSDTYYGETLAAILVEGAVKVAAFSDYGNATVELPLEG